MITIKIDPEESQLVEKAYYEYNATLNILSFILKQGGVNNEYIDSYTKESEKRFITLEEYKTAISTKYMPKDGKTYNYNFDFINKEINFFPRDEFNE